MADISHAIDSRARYIYSKNTRYSFLSWNKSGGWKDFENLISGGGGGGGGGGTLIRYSRVDYYLSCRENIKNKTISSLT